MKKRKLFLSLGLMGLCATALVSCGKEVLTTKDVPEAPIDVLSEYIEELPKVDTATSSFMLSNTDSIAYQSISGVHWAAIQQTSSGSNLYHVVTKNVICPITEDTIYESSNGFLVVIKIGGDLNNPTYSYKVYAQDSSSPILSYTDRVRTSYEISNMWRDTYETDDITHNLTAYSISLSNKVVVFYKDINSLTSEVSYKRENPMEVSKVPGYSEIGEIYTREVMIDESTKRIEFVNEEGNKLSSVDLDETRLTGYYTLSSTLIYQYADQIDSEATKYDFYRINSQSGECLKFNFSSYKFDINTGTSEEIKEVDYLLYNSIDYKEGSEYRLCNYCPFRDEKLDSDNLRTGLFDKEGKLVYKVSKLNLEKTYKLSNGNYLSRTFENSSYYNLYSGDLELLAANVTPDATYTIFYTQNCQCYDVSGKIVLNPARGSYNNGLIQAGATLYEIINGGLKEVVQKENVTRFTAYDASYNDNEKWEDEWSEVTNNESPRIIYKHVLRKMGTNIKFTVYSYDSYLNSISRVYSNGPVSIYRYNYDMIYSDKECTKEVMYFGLR